MLSQGYLIGGDFLMTENTADKAYNGKPCRVSQMVVGNTEFTVISVQSESAKETLYEKLKKHIMTRTKAMCDS